jgi:hypothetical protein
MKLIFNFATLDITVMECRERFGPWCIYVSSEIEDFFGGLSASRKVVPLGTKIYTTQDTWKPYELKKL